jgi:hypothetical protein
VDVAALTPPSSPSWNPLRCDGTTLPAGWLLAAKLLAFAILRGQRFLGAGPPFLPFLPLFDSPGFAGWIAPVTAAVFCGSFVCLMFNRWVQPMCLALAGCVLVHVAGHRLEYANNLMFATVFLLLIGLYHPRTGQWPLRIQLAIVYGGASLNKALDPDWWNGRFFDTLMIDALHVGWYADVAGLFPERTLGMLAGATAIAVEAAICASVIVGRDGRLGVLLMLVFHVVMLGTTRGQLSLPFTYASLAVTAAFFFPLIAVSSRWIEPALWWATALGIRAIPYLLILV